MYQSSAMSDVPSTTAEGPDGALGAASPSPPAGTAGTSGKGLETREQLKRVALALFAERGVDQVSVRDILSEAGQRSGGALHYHFGGKEGLLRELIADAARVFDEARLKRLAAIKAQGAPTLRDVLRVLADPFDSAREQHVPRGYGALMNALQVEHYQAFIAGVEGLDVGYRECISLLRQLLPELPRQQLNQRIRLMMLLMFSSAAARERATTSASSEASVWAQFWAEPGSRDTLIDCFEGMLRQPGSSS